MARSKVGSAALLSFFDSHIRIAKGHALYLVAVFYKDHGLFLAIRCLTLGNAARIIELYGFAFVRCHYMPPPSSLRDAARPVKPIADNMLADKFRKLRNSGSKRANLDLTSARSKVV